MNQAESARTPSRREKLRPWELVIGSALAAVFAGVIVFAGTRMWEITLIAVGGIFIVTLMALAMFALAVKPSPDEIADIAEQDGSR